MGNKAEQRNSARKKKRRCRFKVYFKDFFEDMKANFRKNNQEKKRALYIIPMIYKVRYKKHIIGWQNPRAIFRNIRNSDYL